MRPESYTSLSHGSCRSSFAVGLFLGSSFMILQINVLSSSAGSSSSACAKGFHFWLSMIYCVASPINSHLWSSFGRISKKLSGNGPKKAICFTNTWLGYDSSSGPASTGSGLKICQPDPHIKLMSYNRSAREHFTKVKTDLVTYSCTKGPDIGWSPTSQIQHGLRASEHMGTNHIPGLSEL